MLVNDELSIEIASDAHMLKYLGNGNLLALYLYRGGVRCFDLGFIGCSRFTHFEDLYTL